MIRCAVLDFQCDAESRRLIVQRQRGLDRDPRRSQDESRGHFERGHQRPLCRHACPHRSVERNQTIMGGRRVGVGVSNIPAATRIAVSRRIVDRFACRRAAPHRRRRPTHRSGRSRAEFLRSGSSLVTCPARSGGNEFVRPKPGELRSSECDTRDLDFILVGVMPSRVEPFVGKGAAKDLQRHFAVGPVRATGLHALPSARPATCRRTDEHIAEEGREVGDDHAASPSRHSIPQHQRRAAFAGSSRAVSGSLPMSASSDRRAPLPCDHLGVGDPGLHSMGDVIRGASADGVVEL